LSLIKGDGAGLYDLSAGIKDLGEPAPTEISCFHSPSQISNPKLVLSITSSLKMV